RRVGGPQLTQPGQRMEAIAAVERQLSTHSEDPGGWDLKRLLYSTLTEADYEAVAGKDKVAAQFDHGYAQQLGLALINDTERWQRGAEYLRMAARGLPVLGPSIFTQIAQALQRAGNAEGALHNFEMAQRTGRAVGAKNLAPEEQKAYFAAVKFLAESATARGDWEAAIENYHLYTEHESSGLEVLRTLAGLYERKGDPLSALRIVEIALCHKGNDKDLLERKDRYYFSVMPQQLAARIESVRNAFDTAYCIEKAKTILDTRNIDIEMVDWALHLAELAQVMDPNGVQAKVLRARGRLQRGEREGAVAILEELCNNRPQKLSGDDEEAWHLANRLLGTLYLNELSRPDLAIPCFHEFRKSSKSGADTNYRLGQAYEATGDAKNALRFYEQVTAYEQHPLAADAREAVYRLKSGTTAPKASEF
ncbi:MAG: hypothetical protein K2R98_26260, partial [Gemmataceae bacterium]|nr:hypothetical protein [Gemmataceae bacterium]